jgi:hypothetical protein
VTVTITHTFVSSKQDGANSSLVQPSNWNEAHDFVMASGYLLGRKTASTGAVEELSYTDIWDLIGIVSGTAMIFPAQATAPTGWTKQTTHNNKAFRLVTGAASSGGSTTFSATYVNATTGSFALTSAHLPAHTHTWSATSSSDGAHSHTFERCQDAGIRPGTGGTVSGSVGYGDNSGQSDTTGSGGAHSHTLSGTSDSAGTGTGHTHTLDLAVQYVDAIYATRDAAV